MAIKDYVEESACVRAGNTEIVLYPLTLPDVQALATEHFDQIYLAINQYPALLADGGDPKIIVSSLAGVFAQIPDVVAKLICISAREPDAIADARTLPMGVQMMAIGEIFRLSTGDSNFNTTGQAVHELLSIASDHASDAVH